MIPIIIILGYFVFTFWAILQEGKGRREKFIHQFSGYFSMPDGRIYQIESSEFFIGRSRNAEFRIYLPGVSDRKWPEDINPFHAYVEQKNDGWLYIQNLSSRIPITVIKNDGTKRLLTSKDGQQRLYHNMRHIFGTTYEIRFHKGVGE